MKEKKRESSITEALNIVYYIWLAVVVGLVLYNVFPLVVGDKKRMSFFNHEVVISVSVEEYYNALELWDMFAYTEATKEMEKALDIAKKTKKKLWSVPLLKNSWGNFILIREDLKKPMRY